LMQVLERVTGKKVQAQYRLDPELIGGTTARIGSTIYDASVREQLNRLRTELESQ
jgi:F-type H+-transporting ATPase subunit delta